MARRSSTQHPAEAVHPRKLIGPLMLWLVLLLAGFGICHIAVRKWPDVWSSMVRNGGRLTDRQVRRIWRALEVVPEARRAMALAELGTRFTRTWRGPGDPAALLRDVQQLAGREPLVSMPAARLYEVAACLLLAQRELPQRDAARARALTLVTQLNARPLRHGLDAAAAALTSSLASELVQHTGGTTGDAERLALIELGQPHGPLVEYLAPRLVKLAGEQDAAGDHAAAARVRRLVYHWLSSWVRQPGPPALRALSADVLADVLASDPAFGARGELIDGLRKLRRAYREDLERNAPPPERIRGCPQWRREATRRLIAQVAQVVWIGSGAILTGLIGAVATLVALARGTACPSKTSSRSKAYIVAVGGGLLLWLVGRGMLAAGWIPLPEALPDAATTRKAMIPVASAAAAATVILACGQAVVARRPRAPGLAHGLLWLAIVLTVLLQVSALRLSRGRGGGGTSAHEPGRWLTGVFVSPEVSGIIRALPERLPVE